MMETKQKWYDRQEYKTRQGELIIPADFPAFKYQLKNEWVVNRTKTKLYFKKDGISNYSEGELIYSFFAKHFDMNVVDVIPAVQVYKENYVRKGVAIENFISNSKTQKYITAYDLKSLVARKKFSITSYTYMASQVNSIENNMALLKDIEYAIENKKPDKKIMVDKDIKQDMFQMHLLDYLFVNEDRHSNNFAFLIEEKKDCYRVSLSKIFDNSLVLGLSKFLYTDTNEVTKFFVKNHINNLGFRMSVKKQFSKSINLDVFAKEVAQEIIKNQNLANLYKRMRRFDFDNFESIVQKDIPEYKLEPEVLKIIKLVFQQTTRRLNRYIKYYNELSEQKTTQPEMEK